MLVTSHRSDRNQIFQTYPINLLNLHKRQDNFINSVGHVITSNKKYILTSTPINITLNTSKQ